MTTKILTSLLICSFALISFSISGDLFACGETYDAGKTFTNKEILDRAIRRNKWENISIDQKYTPSYKHKTDKEIIVEYAREKLPWLNSLSNKKEGVPNEVTLTDLNVNVKVAKAGGKVTFKGERVKNKDSFYNKNMNEGFEATITAKVYADILTHSEEAILAEEAVEINLRDTKFNQMRGGVNRAREADSIDIHNQ
ncbi:MAG: hypothetical protein ABW090_09420 [Sedimenticola sp.]